ncbi:hypothetical protein P4E94_09310 [Pontiellaceae bacterium B12219]|nr:hypothetical protein [Pontiellaceae bacterium B12219]
MHSQLNQANLGRNALLFGIVGACLFAGFFFNPLMIWGLFICIITTVIFIGHPPQLLFMYWFWMSVVASILQVYTPGSVFGLVPEAMLAAVSGLAIFSFAMRRSVDPSVKGLLKVYGWLLFVIFISFALNGSKIKNIAMAFTEYYAFLLVFLAASIFLTPSEKRLRFIVKVAIAHLYFCIVLNILGFMGLNPLVANRIIFDKAIGTFPSQGSMGFYSIAMLFLSLGMVVHLEKGKQRILWVIVASLSFFSFFITFNFHAYIYLIVLYFMFTVLYPRERALKVGLGFLAVFLFILSTLIAPSLMGLGRDEFGHDIMGQVTDTTYLRERIDRVMDSPKVEVFQKMIIHNFQDSPVEWWIGNGPGMGIGSVGVKYVTPTAWEYLAEYYFTYTGAESMGQKSALQTPHNGLYAIWSDIGAVGFFVYIGIYVYAAIHILRNIRTHKYTNNYQLVLAESCVLWIALLVATNFMSDTFNRHELLGGLWIFTALVWNPIKEVRIEPESALSEVRITNSMEITN